jgi:glyoxylase-like metal-dependent hydrolase (beta-lactamase superfamily II)
VDHLRVLRPAAGVFAFYDGRVDGYRFDARPNWVDDGALSLGIASYAIVSGASALVYDTHVSVEHGRWIRGVLEDAGVRTFTVVLSHWHLDHVAGTGAFGDCEVIACERTADLLAANREAIVSSSLEGPPAIDPLVLPTTTFRDLLELEIGELHVELLHTDIHSDDATVVWWPDRELLLCGDTMEDTVTYVGEPENLRTHRANLDGLRRLRPKRILPNHGDPDVIAAGGYADGLIGATEQYIDFLLRSRGDASLGQLTLREVVAALGNDALHYYAPYEDVHRQNLEVVRRRRPGRQSASP